LISLPLKKCWTIRIFWICSSNLSKIFLQIETPAEKRQNEGLFKVFAENFPISDSRENFVLEFVDYTIDPPKYSVDECIDRGLTYSVPL